MAAKFKYCLGGGELVIKDMKAVAGTYVDGEVLVPGLADSGGVRSAADGDGASIIGVSNQGDTLPAAATLQSPGVTTASTGAVLAGTHGAGTIENLKVIVNPDAVYALEYDQGSPITKGSVTDTTIPYTCANAEGFDSDTMSGGWAWGFTTGVLDYITDSSTSTTTCTLTTVTGTDTTAGTMILLHPANSGLSKVIELNGAGTLIAAGEADVGVVGANGINGIVLENRLEGIFSGSEILDPVTHNQEVRWMNSNTTTSVPDRTKAFGYIKFAHVLHD